MTTPDPHYRATLATALWDYQRRAFGDRLEWFEEPRRSGDRPPVFRPEFADHNLMMPSGVSDAVATSIRSAIPRSTRQRWFRSMKSSQALAQSVFAGLAATGEIEALTGLRDDDGELIFPPSGPGPMELERDVTNLGEPRSTSVDVWFGGTHRVAIECKLTEAAIGSCSRPGLRPREAAYDEQSCDGTYTRQRHRQDRCSLTHIGVTYWHHIPEILSWDSSTDLRPCPLAPTYQLVRNILAATVTDSGTLDPQTGTVVLLNDARNPANADDGSVGVAYATVKRALRSPRLLRRCSWQQLTAHLDSEGTAEWLVRALAAKYGIC